MQSISDSPQWLYHLTKTSQTPVGMTSILMHFNPHLFPSPHTFSPDRWLQPHAAHLRKFIVAFSKGSRQCLGMKCVVRPLQPPIIIPFSFFPFGLCYFAWQSISLRRLTWPLVWLTANCTSRSPPSSHRDVSNSSSWTQMSGTWRWRTISSTRARVSGPRGLGS